MTRLPGIKPLEWADWLVVDEAFAAQMALRDQLLRTRRGDVFAVTEGSDAASTAVLDLILDHLGESYERGPKSVTRPDGVTVALDGDHPLVVAARLVQQDLCIMQLDGQGQHRLAAAVLCFPASWSLAEKIGRPLDIIHDPVDSYTPDIARRVQRLFDAMRPDRPLWRQNALLYADPALYQPRTLHNPRDRGVPPSYVRSEKQCLIRLPDTDAALFSIHTYVVPLQALPRDAQAGLLNLEAAG